MSSKQLNSYFMNKNKNAIGGNKLIIWLSLVILVFASAMIANTQFCLVNIDLPTTGGTDPEIFYGSAGTILGSLLLIAGFKKN